MKHSANCIKAEDLTLPKLSGLLSQHLVSGEELPDTVAKAYKALERIVVEAIYSPEPLVVFILGEWGDGKTSVYEALLAPLAERLGVTSLYLSGLKLAMGRGLLNKVSSKILAKSRRNRLLVFIDEAEDLVYSRESAEKLAKTIIQLVDQAAGGRVVAIGITPPAYSRFQGFIPPSITPRLARRIRVIELPKLDLRNCRVFAEKLAEKIHPKGLKAVLEDKRLILPLLLSSGCSLGGVAWTIRLLFSKSLQLGYNSCGEKALKRLGGREVLELLGETLAPNTGLPLLNTERLRELAETLATVVGREAAEKLAYELAAKGYMALSEAKNLLEARGEIVEKLIQTISREHSRSHGLGENIVVVEPGEPNNSLLEELGEECSNEPCIALKREALEALFSEPSYRLLDFLGDREERKALAKTVPKDRDVALGFSTILALSLTNAGFNVRSIKSIGEYSIVELLYKNTRINILVTVGKERLEENRIKSLLVLRAKPHIAIVLHQKNNNSCREVKEAERMHIGIICSEFDSSDWLRLGILGRKIGERKLDGDSLREKLGEEGLLIPVLEVYGDRLVLEKAVQRRILEAAKRGIDGVPLVLLEDPPRLLRDLARCFTLYTGSPNPRSMENYLATIARILPPRPRGHSLVRGEAKRYAVRGENLLSLPEKLLKWAVELSEWEKLLLKALEFFEGEARLEDLAVYTGAQYERLEAWIEVLKEKGLITVEDSGSSRRVVLIDPRRAISEAKKALSRLEEEVKDLQEQFYATRIEGSLFVSRLGDGLEIARKAIETASEKIDENHYLALRLARGARIALMQLHGMASCLKEAENRIARITRALEEARRALEKPIEFYGMARIEFSPILAKSISRVVEEAGKAGLKEECTKYLQYSCGSIALSCLSEKIRLYGLAEAEWIPSKGVPKRIEEILRFREKLEKIVREAKREIEETYNRIREKALQASITVETSSQPLVIQIDVASYGDVATLFFELRTRLEEARREIKEREKQLDQLVSFIRSVKELVEEYKLVEGEAKTARALLEKLGVDASLLDTSIREAREAYIDAQNTLKAIRSRVLASRDPERAIEALRDARMVLSDAISRARAVLREYEARLAEKLETLLKIVSQVSGASRPLVKLDYYVARKPINLELLSRTLAEAVRMKEEVVEKIAAREGLSSIEAKTLSLLIEAKTQYGELPFSKAVILVAEQMKLGEKEAKKTIISLIERGLLDPKI